MTEPDESSPQEETETPEDEFSLEELSAAYARIAALSDEDGDSEASIVSGEVLQREHLVAPENESTENGDGETLTDDPDQDWDSIPETESEEAPATPHAIVEAALFVGHPENAPLTAPRLASIMRDVTPEEVTGIIDELNASYRENRQGFRIAQDDSGYRMVIAPEVEGVRMAFSGKVRETRLNQAAIEVLSLVAYQPGITSAEVTDLRGRDSGPLLNQMVRRRLVEVRREPVAEPAEARGNESKSTKNKSKKEKLVSRFYPAERLLVLLGLDSLEDLPHVEEAHL